MAVVYGAIGNVSIAGLFLGGIVPGLMVGLGLMVFCYFFGPVGLSPAAVDASGSLAAATRAAALPMMIPVILLGGILTGWFTPTEAGVVAIAYILRRGDPAAQSRPSAPCRRDFVQAGLIYSLPLITIARGVARSAGCWPICAGRSWSPAGSARSPAPTRTRSCSCWCWCS